MGIHEIFALKFPRDFQKVSIVLDHACTIIGGLDE